MRAGDVVMGDARLLHSAHANRSDERRTVLTVWYWPVYDDLPEEVQARVSGHVTEMPDWRRRAEQTRTITGGFAAGLRRPVRPGPGLRQRRRQAPSPGAVARPPPVASLTADVEPWLGVPIDLDRGEGERCNRFACC